MITKATRTPRMMRMVFNALMSVEFCERWYTGGVPGPLGREKVDLGTIFSNPGNTFPRHDQAPSLRPPDPYRVDDPVLFRLQDQGRPGGKHEGGRALFGKQVREQ